MAVSVELISEYPKVFKIFFLKIFFGFSENQLKNQSFDRNLFHTSMFRHPLFSSPQRSPIPRYFFLIMLDDLAFCDICLADRRSRDTTAGN